MSLSGSNASSASRSDLLDQALAALLQNAREIEAAAVVSFDGLPMASALPASMDEDRVAAMSAALLSLGERAAQGLGRGELSQVYIEGETGTVFLVSADNEAVLVAVARQGAKVGMMLYEVRRAAAAVADALREEQEVVVPGPAPVAEVPSQTIPEPVLAAVPDSPTLVAVGEEATKPETSYVSPLDSSWASSYGTGPSNGSGGSAPHWS
jgi:hypothetical protein